LFRQFNFNIVSLEQNFHQHTIAIHHEQNALLDSYNIGYRSGITCYPTWPDPTRHFCIEDFEARGWSGCPAGLPRLDTTGNIRIRCVTTPNHLLLS
jgi:hypothetical protein